MRFRYSFQKIVDLKSNEKTQAEWVLSNAVGILQNEEDHLLTLDVEKTDIHHQLSSAVTDTTNISQVMQYQSYLNHLKQVIVQKNIEVEKAQRNVEDKKVYLTEKLKEEKVWMKARERAQNLHSEVMRKKEQSELDEIATTRFQRPS
mgnify:CR=1 FL=1